MKKQNETKQGNFRMWKSKKGWVYTGALLLVVGGSTGAVLAQTGGLKAFNAPARSLPKPPSSGTVNFQYTGTGGTYWSDGWESDAQFLTVNGNTTFCLDPFTPIEIGALATQAGQNDAAMKQWEALTPYQRNLVNNITYIGLVNNAANDPDMNLATQFAMWMVEAGQNQVPGLLPVISELDTTKLNNVYNGRTITNLYSHGADIQKVVGHTTTLIKQALAAAKDPDFNPNPLEIVAGSSATSTDKNGVLAGNAGGYGLPFDNLYPSEGLTAKRKGNSLEVSATPKAIGKNGTVDVWNGKKDFNPSYIYGSIDPDGKVAQTLFVTTDPALLTGQLKVKVIGLGEVELQKSSTNSDFSKKAMAGAEFTLYNKNGTVVKWSDGQSGHVLTPTSGTKANNTNVVLKMGEDAKLGLKNLDFTKEYYFMETKAPAGFALNAVKIPVTFDENSKFNGSTNNYQDNVATQDIPTGSVVLTKVDADTGTSETQGEATLKGVTYGLFHPDGKAVEWSEGLTDKTPGSTVNLPIEPSFGTKGDPKKVEVTVDASGKAGIKHLPLKEKGTNFYLQEVRTSSGYSQSTKKIPVVFDGNKEVDVSTNDFLDNERATDKVDIFSFMFNKAQEVNGSLTGLNGAEFTLTPKAGTKGKPIKAISGTGVDSNGFTVNGLTVFDGKANEAAGNPSKDGIAIGDYTLTETKTPAGLKAINPIDLTVDDTLDKDGVPLSYTATFKDTVTGQIVDKITIDAATLVDNNVMFKVNLGIFTDKAQEQPKITTTATDKADGDKTLGVGQAQVTDKAQMSHLPASAPLHLTGKVVYKDTGEEVKDENGKSITASKDFTSNKDGSATVQLDFPVINTAKDQDKDYTVTEVVTDSKGTKVVEENNYKDNPSQTVKVAKAKGHTEVQDKFVESSATKVTDKFFYDGLVAGDTYTVKINKAYDHELGKEIDVAGSLTFKAEESSGTVDVPVTFDGKKYAGHTLTFYEDLWGGEKPSEKEEPIFSSHNKDDQKETFAINKLPVLATTATDKADGDKTLGVGEAQVTDLAKMSYLPASTSFVLTGKVVYKDTGEEVKDAKGKAITASKTFVSNAKGSASVQLDFPVINTVNDQDKDYTVTEVVTDEEGVVIVEENNYKDNPSQTVKVDKAKGHTEVQEKFVESSTTTVTDKFFYDGLVAGDTYTVKINQAYDHELEEEIDVAGSLTFKAEDSSGTVDVPVTIDGKKYAGHTLTFYEDLWVGEKIDEKEEPIFSSHDKDDQEETFAINKLPILTTTATDKIDGDKTLGVGEAQVTDLAKMSYLPASAPLHLTGTVVYKDTGKEVKDENGKSITASKDFTANKDGSATVQLDFPVINTLKDQGKDYTVTEVVTDKEGLVIVEENNYKDNPSQTVKVDKADGHTEVQDKEITPETTTVKDKFFYEGFVPGDTYTVKITQAWDHDLKEVIEVEGSLTFKAEAPSGVVEVPVKVDAKKYAGHKITFYEDVWHGEKPSGKEEPVVSHHNKDDQKETFTVKAIPKDQAAPEKPKGILPETGEEKALWTLGGLSLIGIAAAILKRDKIKALFNKDKK